jgi:hypothetical protein
MLRGTFVALITPFAGEEIDEPRLRDLVDWLIANRVDGLVPCGTTGETPSLSDTEWQRVAAVVIEQAAGRVPGDRRYGNKFHDGHDSTNPRGARVGCDRCHGRHALLQ